MHRIPVTVVEVTRTHLALSSVIVVDVQGLMKCAERILRPEAPQDWNEVRQLIRGGELLPDWYDDWVAGERDQLHQLRLVALEVASDNLLNEGRYAEATTSALAAVTADPLRESARRLLIRSHLGAGNLAEALRQYAVFRARLEHDLGLEPSRQMKELAQMLRDDDT
jgi:DNA-binding SARP family transcriptional activator